MFIFFNDQVINTSHIRQLKRTGISTITIKSVYTDSAASLTWYFENKKECDKAYERLTKTLLNVEMQILEEQYSEKFEE